MTQTDAQVVALAKEQEADVLISDDAMVRARARGLGLEVVGTLGILLEAKRDGHLPDLRGVLDQLIQAGFYLRPVVRCMNSFFGEGASVEL